MNIKTISQITPLDGDIELSSYFGISQYSPIDGGKFSSRKVSFGKIQDQLATHIDEEFFIKKYQAQNNKGAISINKLRNDVNSLSASNVTLKGIKTFTSTPVITNTVDTNNKNNIPNIKCVQELIADKAGFISKDQYLNFDPYNSNGYTKYDGHESNPKQLYWHINHNQRDSSEWIDEYGNIAGSVICNHTGNLVCYGWLADNGNVRPETAWVGLFGRIKINDNNSSKSTWVALQIQPWIIGKYSSTLQYISFNIPVQSGLELKIMTGFNVNGNNTGLSEHPTLMFAEEGNMPNTFVGYILHTS